MTHPIPSEALKESVAIIGRTGSGKTYTAKGAVEQLLEEQARVCIIDPTGVWWGLRTSADGKLPAFPVVVFGGDHADVPIGDASGAAVAELLAGQNLPAILDVSEFTMGARVRFVTGFLDELYRANRNPLTLVIDEADLFAPQRALPDQTLMLSRMEQICRRGRVRGFRPWLITQRPAELHKSVLSQANTLIAMQLTAPQDRAAVGDWIEGQADRDEGKKILASLAKLQKGEGWVWSPSHDVLQRVRFPELTTFDSSRTPEEGATVAPVLPLAAVDLAAIGDKLQQLDQAKSADDPKALRERIQELEQALERRVRPDDETLLEEYRRGLRDGRESIRRAVQLAIVDEGVIIGGINLPDDFRAEPGRIQVVPAEASRDANDRGWSDAAQSLKRTRSAGAGENLAEGERRILTACAQHRKGCTREQLTVLTGYKRSTRDAYLQRLRQAGRVDIGATITATVEGMAALGPGFEQLPTGRELRAYWLARLPEGEARILEQAVRSYPKPVEREALSKATGFQRSTRDAYVQRLKSRQLLQVVGPGAVRASAELF